MSRISVEITPSSLRKFFRDIHKFEERIQLKVKDAVSAAALDIETDTKENSIFPVDTGRLRASVHAIYSEADVFEYSDKNGVTYEGGAFIPGVDIDRYAAGVGTNVEYAPFQKKARASMNIGYQNGKRSLIKDINTILKKAGK